MGRQIEFVHTEEDTICFLETIEKFGGRIMLDGAAVLPTSVDALIVEQMASYMCKFSVVCADDECISNRVDKASVFSGTAIDFLNCRKGTPGSRTYETGRIYISTNCDGEYDSHTLVLYNLLSGYIKKKYNYSKLSKLYVSDGFKAKYDAHYFYAARLGRYIRL